MKKKKEEREIEEENEKPRIVEMSLSPSTIVGFTVFMFILPLLALPPLGTRA